MVVLKGSTMNQTQTIAKSVRDFVIDALIIKLVINAAVLLKKLESVVF